MIKETDIERIQKFRNVWNLSNKKYVKLSYIDRLGEYKAYFYLSINLLRNILLRTENLKCREMMRHMLQITINHYDQAVIDHMSTSRQKRITELNRLYNKSKDQ